VSLKYVINIILWIRDTGCYTPAHHETSKHDSPNETKIKEK
jgi:hypothetical protein